MGKQSNFERREADFTPRVRDTDNNDPRRPFSKAGCSTENDRSLFSKCSKDRAKLPWCASPRLGRMG
jgi:hypothetical protein